MRLRLSQSLKQSLCRALIFFGVGGLFVSSLTWAGEFPRAVLVDGPRGSLSQDGSRAAGSHVSTQSNGATAVSQMQDLSTNEQARIYQRANENLITQTVYIEENLTGVKKLRDKLDDNAPEKLTEDERLNLPILTSQYCTSDTVSTNDGARACLDQFREMRVAQLRELQQGLVKNDDAQARLRQELKSAKNKTGGSNRAPVYGANIKQRVFPEIPKYIDMQKDFASRAKVIPDKRLRQSEAEAIAQRMLTPPNREDFVKVTESLIDPSNPQAGTFHQIVTGRDGKPVIDESAFRQAQEIYKRMSLAPHSSDQNPVQAIAKRIMDAQDSQQTLLSQNNSMDAAVGTPNSPKGPQACGLLPVGPRQDYCRARDLVVRFFNGEDDSQQSTQAQRTVKNGASRKPTAVHLSSGAHTEDYELKAAKPSANGKNETENLYMEPSYIDDVINAQYPK